MTRYIRNKQVEIAPMQDETVLFNPESKKFFVLNQTGASIWRRLESPAGLQELQNALCEEFDGADPAVVEGDVKETIRRLEEFQLVEIEE